MAQCGRAWVAELGRRVLAATLCLLLLSAHCSSARSLRKRALQLSHKYDDYEYQLYPHNTNYQKNDRCPPPPQSLPDRACEVPSCRSDSECERHKRCCYNGCIYACLESVQPPPGGLAAETSTLHTGAKAIASGPTWQQKIPRHRGSYQDQVFHTTTNLLDWLVQPKPRWLGGNGWLLDGPEEVLQAEACSTTEDGDEPLHCPTGYECHIINAGSPAEGIPNRGQCIKQRGNSDGRNLRHKYYKEYLGGHYNNVVVGKDKEPQKHLG
ncbi:hypothetical protein FKM82_003656 [Ascaphus truei]